MAVRGSGKTAPASTLVNGNVRNEKGLQMQHLLVGFFPPRALPYCSSRQSHVGADFRSKNVLIQGLIALAHSFLQAHRVTLLKSVRTTRSFLPTSAFQTKCKWNNVEQNTNLLHFCEKPQSTKFSLLLAKRVSNSRVMDGSTFECCSYSLVEIKV